MYLAQRKYVPFNKGEHSIRDDQIFRIVFGSNQRSEYLKDFLESILHRKITNIVILNDVALDIIHKDNKNMRLDILAEVDGKEKINVELQNKNEYNIFDRSDAYVSGIVHNSLNVGDKYDKVPKTMVIWILGFNVFKDGNYHEESRMTREYNGEPIDNNITYHFIQLPKFLEQTRQIKTKEEQWLAYFTHSLNKEELEELFAMNRSIEEINKIVDIVMTDQDVRDALNERILAENLERLKAQKAYDDGKEAGIEQGIEKGIEQGIEQKNRENAKKMREKGIDIEIIKEVTGLTEEEIEDL